MQDLAEKHRDIEPMHLGGVCRSRWPTPSPRS